MPKRLHSLLAVIFLGLIAASVGAAAQSKAAQPQIKFEKYTLKNGMDVILHEDHRLPLVTVNFWYHVGPANERPGRTGFAHLFEHMMFEGSQHVGPKAIFKYLEGAGASDINGSTDFDRTNYFETLPSNQLELALWLESDRMGYLLGTLDREKLANQRDVVRNERRQSLENAPYGLVEEGLVHLILPKEHPYYAEVIGSHRDIEAAQIDDVREFFRQYYTPNNTSLVIAGDMDPAKTKQLVEKYFGTIPSGPPVPKITATTPPITSERRATIEDQVELPRVYMAWLTAPIYQPGNVEANLLAQLLGGGKSSRLYKKLVYEKQIAQDVTVTNQSLLLGSMFELQATAKQGVRIEDLEKAIDEELSKLRNEGPAQAELDRARNVIESQKIRSLERGGTLANQLNFYNHYLGDPGFLSKDLERYDHATVADLKRVAQQALQTNARAVVYGVPGKKVVDDVPKTAEAAATKEAAMAGTMPDEPWRAKAPEAGPASRLSLPVPTSFKLKNGLTVMLSEQHMLPVVVANMVVLAGSDANPATKPGLASFTASMLEEGTDHRSAPQIADEADQTGTVLDSASTSDYSQLSMRTLKQNADAAFNLLADVTLHPKFDAVEVERVRKRRAGEILQEKSDPQQTAFVNAVRAIYGPSHPLGYRELGTEESNRAITADDLRRFWQQGYGPENAALVLAGDLTEAEARKLAEKYFGSWQGGSHRNAVLPVDHTAQRTIYLVDTPGSPQSVVIAAQLGVPRSTPDYVPIEVMNNGLGGLFSSRLNMNLREEHGYTYGAFSFFGYRRGPGIFAAGGAIRTDATASAVSETMKEMERIRTVPLSADELKLAQGAFSLSLAGLFENSAQTAATVGGLFTYNLPPDYWRNVGAQAGAVTSAEVQRVAQKYIHPDTASVIVVGDRAKVEEDLKKLSLGPVEIRDASGNPVK